MHTHSDHQFDHQKLMRECPVCGTDYQDDAFHILSEADDLATVHVTCESCDNAIMALFAVTPMGMSTVGIITDLSPDDYDVMESLNTISEDDVLDFHSCMKEGAAFEQALQQSYQ